MNQLTLAVAPLAPGNIINKALTRPARHKVTPRPLSPMRALNIMDRPREKMLAKGERSLNNAELLQVIIGSGIRGADVTKISADILDLLQMQNGKATLDQLTGIRGVSTATATRLVASLELTSRFVKTGMRIDTVEDVLPLLADIRHKKQEHFVVITLDGANRVIEKRIITVGTINASLVHPREVFADAITDRAASIVVAHNHPSGTLHPSAPDLEVTKRLEVSGKLFDHIIVTADSYVTVEL